VVAVLAVLAVAAAVGGGWRRRVEARGHPRASAPRRKGPTVREVSSSKGREALMVPSGRVAKSESPKILAKPKGFNPGSGADLTPRCQRPLGTHRQTDVDASMPSKAEAPKMGQSPCPFFASLP
jgi:hypothetical protein